MIETPKLTREELAARLVEDFAKWRTTFRPNDSEAGEELSRMIAKALARQAIEAEAQGVPVAYTVEEGGAWNTPFAVKFSDGRVWDKVVGWRPAPAPTHYELYLGEDHKGQEYRVTISPVRSETVERCHPSHETRVGDASSWDAICVKCDHTDIAGGGWGKLAKPCEQEHSPYKPWAIPPVGSPSPTKLPAADKCSCGSPGCFHCRKKPANPCPYCKGSRLVPAGHTGPLPCPECSTRAKLPDDVAERVKWLLNEAHFQEYAVNGIHHLAAPMREIAALIERLVRENERLKDQVAFEQRRNVELRASEQVFKTHEALISTLREANEAQGRVIERLKDCNVELETRRNDAERRAALSGETG